jgi:hypothetical protein
MISKAPLQKFFYRRILNYVATKPIPYLYYFFRDFGIANDQLENTDIFLKIAGKKTISDFYGYECADFIHNYRLCKLVRPKKPAPGNPWIFRARIWDLHQRLDERLLEEGFHIAYCDLRELYGNDESIALITDFYQYMQKIGLHRKVAMIAISRGSFYAYSWAAKNGEKISCIYADNPPLDFKSWPGGFGKAKRSLPDWKIFKKKYKLKSEEDVLAFRRSPIDLAAEIAGYQFPILHVCSGCDEFVPLDENSLPFRDKIIEHGGNIKIIVKEGAYHQSHGLTDPGKILSFILNATNASS